MWVDVVRLICYCVSFLGILFFIYSLISCYYFSKDSFPNNELHRLQMQANSLYNRILELESRLDFLENQEKN